MAAAAGTDGAARGRGLAYSGSHGIEERVSRTTSAARSTLWSMNSATSLEYLRTWTGMLDSCVPESVPGRVARTERKGMGAGGWGFSYRV